MVTSTAAPGTTAGGVWQRPRLELQDLAYPLYLPALLLLSAVLPETWWPRACRAFALPSRLLARRQARRRAAIERMLAGRDCPVPAAEIAARMGASYHEARMHCLRHYVGRGWRPAIRLEGRAHLDEALARGRGAILWVESLAFSALVTKMALHRAGFGVCHLSRSGHGFSQSRLGGPLFNPLWTRVEGRYLAERIVIRGDSAAGAATTLLRRLKANRPVSITVTPFAQRLCRVPMLGGEVRLPVGPVKLARQSGAALLPVFSVRVAPKQYVTTIEAPLEVGRAGDEEAPLHAYAGLLESYILRWPGQYRGW